MSVGRLVFTFGVHDDTKDERQESTLGRILREYY